MYMLHIKHAIGTGIPILVSWNLPSDLFLLPANSAISSFDPCHRGTRLELRFSWCAPWPYRFSPSWFRNFFIL